MATSIIDYKKKYLDINDNILIFSLYFIKIVAKSRDLPDWFANYIENVIDVVIDVRPVGWGYMSLEEYLLDDKEKKEFYIEMVKETVNYLKRRKSNILDNVEVNFILNTEGLERWKEKQYLDTKHIIRFLKDVVILLDDNTSLDHPRLMKTRKE